MNAFFTTLLITLPLFIGAALLFNFAKKKVRRPGAGIAGTCHSSGGTIGCSCSSQVQTMIRRLDEQRSMKNS